MPLPPPPQEYTDTHLRFATQPIVDRRGQVAGTELLFRWNSMDGGVTPLLGAYATATVLCNALLDGQWLTRPETGTLPVGSLYVNMDEAYLLSPMAEALTPDLGVIELLESLHPTPAVRRRVRDLHSRGYRFSLDDVERTDDPRWVLAEHVESVKIDMLATSARDIKPLIGMAHAAGLRVVAEKVESLEDLETLVIMGVDLFQGYAVARPLVHRVAALPGCDARLMGKLYLMALEGVSAEALAFLAESDPATAVRLLRLQALHAPNQMTVSQDLAAVLASIPRPVLVAWLAKMNIAALHGRGRGRVTAVREHMARYRAGLYADASLQASQRRQWVFRHYCEQLQELQDRQDLQPLTSA